VGANLSNWNRIVASLQVNLSQEMDVFVWGLKASGIFTIKSMYVALINNGVSVARYLANETSNENKGFHVIFEKRSDFNQR
jgi:hypothetical protein